jgi:acetyl-CoA carboxylase carboxyltransferase component
VYDVRDVIRALVDGRKLLEASVGWARNLVTGFARIDGRTVGVVANQPRYLGGIIDADASQKGARFVSKCNAFGIPLLVLVDTPGYMPGTRWRAGSSRPSPPPPRRPSTSSRSTTSPTPSTSCASAPETPVRPTT